MPDTFAPFRAGDRWCSIGDSHTGGGAYQNLVRLFHATRWPQARFEHFNAGIAGDGVQGGLKRFTWDIAVHRPTVATILFGGNDVAGWPWGGGSDSEHILAKKLDEFERGMEELAERLSAIACRTVICTTTFYDDDALIAGKPAEQPCDGGCARVCVRTQALARRLGLPLVDLRTPLLEITRAGQRRDPAFSITSPDRVHLGDRGHLVLAYTILRAQGVPGEVMHLDLAVDPLALRTTRNCRVEDLHHDGDSYAFTCLADALPFPVPVEARPALDLVPLQSELNRETIRVGSLGEGRWRLEIDDLAVGTWSAAEFAAGISLAGLDTPQLRQAEQALRWTQEIRALERLSRGLVRTRFVYLDGIDLADRAAVAARLDLAMAGIAQRPWHAWDTEQCRLFLANLPCEAELATRYASLVDSLWAAVPPVPRRWRIRQA